MSLQFRRGTNEERLLIVPAPGEPIWSTTTSILYVGDGVTVGGIPVIAGGTAGVTEIIAGDNITVDSNTGVVTINATPVTSGVTEIIAGDNITINTSTGAVTITATSTGGGNTFTNLVVTDTADIVSMAISTSSGGGGTTNINIVTEVNSFIHFSGEPVLMDSGLDVTGRLYVNELSADDGEILNVYSPTTFNNTITVQAATIGLNNGSRAFGNGFYPANANNMKIENPNNGAGFNFAMKNSSGVEKNVGISRSGNVVLQNGVIANANPSGLAIQSIDGGKIRLDAGFDDGVTGNVSSIVMTTSSGVVVVVDNYDYGTDTDVFYQSTFGIDGVLTVPALSVAPPTGSGNIVGPNGLTVAAPWVNVVSTSTSDIDLYTNNFEADGVEVWLQHDNQVAINTANGAYSWAFKKDGTQSFPQLTTPHAGTGQTMRFGDPSQQVVITNSTATSTYPNSTRIVVQGSEGYSEGGEGGDIYLWAGNSGAGGGSGGDIKIDAGIGYNDSEGGTIKIRAGNSDGGIGGFVDIHGGNGVDSGGPIRMYSGDYLQQLNIDNAGVKVNTTLIIGANDNTITATGYNELGVSSNFNVPNVLSLGGGSAMGFITSKGNQDLYLQTGDNDGPGGKIVLRYGDTTGIDFYSGGPGGPQIAAFSTLSNTLNYGLTINSADSSKALTVSNSGVSLPVLAADISVNGYKLKGGNYDGNTITLPVGSGPTITAGYEGGVTLRSSTNNTNFAGLNLNAAGTLTLSTSTGNKLLIGLNNGARSFGNGYLPSNVNNVKIETPNNNASIMFAMKNSTGVERNIGFSRQGNFVIGNSGVIGAGTPSGLGISSTDGGKIRLDAQFDNGVTANASSIVMTTSSGVVIAVDTYDYATDTDYYYETTIGIDGTTTLPGLLTLAVYTAAALTAITGVVGQIAIVSNSGGGGGMVNGMMAFWDTANSRWSYVYDNSAV